MGGGWPLPHCPPPDVHLGPIGEIRRDYLDLFLEKVYDRVPRGTLWGVLQEYMTTVITRVLFT